MSEVAERALQYVRDSLEAPELVQAMGALDQIESLAAEVGRLENRLMNQALLVEKCRKMEMEIERLQNTVRKISDQLHYVPD